MTKKELRIIYREKRASLQPHGAEKMQDLILINFQQLSLPFLEYLHIYLPSQVHVEVDTFSIMEYLKFINPGLRVVIPKTQWDDGTMQHYLYDDNTVLVKNKFDILEPAGGELVLENQVDLVLLPLLAFDEKGYRVGYGKGFYDRFLSHCREDVIKIGLSFFDAEKRIDDTDEFDIPLTYCITPGKIYEF
ncbi:MAG: 5-formyltetrahydrofolate cyclo-ligase [Bacteroidetes bacterium]|nr:5-formyltetrahydrofolate cyclo-ligase [Bacteroidota bacterium]